MSTDADILLDSTNGCVSRNALLCCRSPACLNIEPKLVQATSVSATVTTTTTTMADQQIMNMNRPSNGLDAAQLNNASNAYNDQSAHTTVSPQSASSSDPPSPPAEKMPNTINKSQTMIDIRHGVTLRRVSPPKRPITVKTDAAPLTQVVLRKVERKTLLEPPKIPRFEKSPPPKKLTSCANAKHHNNHNAKAAASKNPIAIPKSKSTNDVAIMAKQQLEAAVAKPVNLLKTLRPLEIHKIEGDKIIIIRRIPKSKRAKEPLPPLDDDPTQVTNKQIKFCARPLWLHLIAYFTCLTSTESMYCIMYTNSYNNCWILYWNFALPNHPFVNFLLMSLCPQKLTQLTNKT